MGKIRQIRQTFPIYGRASAQAIILAARKIMYGKKGQEEKIFQCYVIQGVGVLNIMITLMIPYSSKFLWSGIFVIEVINFVTGNQTKIFQALLKVTQYL